MTKKKLNKIDLGQGFKRIFNIIAAFWGFYNF